MLRRHFGDLLVKDSSERAPVISICVKVLRLCVDVFPFEILDQSTIMAQQSNTIDLIIQDANGK